MCNSKSVKIVKEIGKGDFAEAGFDFGKVYISKKLDEKLLNEALLRELVREVQDLRKKNGFIVKEKITLSLSSDEETNEMLGKNRQFLAREVGAKSVVVGSLKGRFRGKLEFEEKKIEIAFDRI
jgi:hypothetical protein